MKSRLTPPDKGFGEMWPVWDAHIAGEAVLRAELVTDTAPMLGCWMAGREVAGDRGRPGR